MPAPSTATTARMAATEEIDRAGRDAELVRRDCVLDADGGDRIHGAEPAPMTASSTTTSAGGSDAGQSANAASVTMPSASPTSGTRL